MGVVADFNGGLPFLDGCFAYILADNSIEHARSDRYIPLMNELWRVLQPGGQLHIFVPHFTSPWAVGDPTHRLFFSEVSFHYFEPGFVEEFADYGIAARFHTERLEWRQGEHIEAILVALK